MSASKASKTATTKKPATKSAAKAPAKAKKPKPAGKLSALDAAAKILTEAGEPMSTKQMIDIMGTVPLETHGDVSCDY